MAEKEVVNKKKISIEIAKKHEDAAKAVEQARNKAIAEVDAEINLDEIS